MSNRQARREQMRSNRQQRAAQRPTQSRTPRGGGGPGPSRRGGGGPLASLLARPFVLLVGLVIIGAIVALGLVVALRGNESGRFADELEVAAANLPLDMADGNVLGNPDAPITLTTYEDFQCPFCLQYTSEREPDIIEEFVKSGEVKLEYKHLPILGTESLRAARASVCTAEQNVFWPFHHKLFLVQAEAGQFDSERNNVGRFSDENLREYAVEAGADGAEFDACFAGQESLDVVTADQTEASSLGIRGTPGFTVNGRPLAGGAPTDIEGWRTVFDQVLADASATPTASASPTAEATTPAASPTPTP